MQRFKVRFTREADQELLRLYDFLLEKALATAGRALGAIEEATRLLGFSPFTYRKILHSNPFLHELVMPFRSSGYVALFEIDDDRTLSVLAVRHQWEEDYK